MCTTPGANSKVTLSPVINSQIVSGFVWVQYCRMSRRITCLVSIGFLLCVVAIAQERWVAGEYRNNAVGFAVRIPNGMRGLTGDRSGPERGVKISLPSGASVTVYGEPNSLEYKTAAEGIQESLSNYCHSGEPTVSAARVGRLRGAKGRVVCGERIIEEMLAFRPGGGLIYWLRLETTNARAADDEAALETIANGFKIIAWR